MATEDPRMVANIVKTWVSEWAKQGFKEPPCLC
jgi:hypothetical protein